MRFHCSYMHTSMYVLDLFHELPCSFDGQELIIMVLSPLFELLLVLFLLVREELVFIVTTGFRLPPRRGITTSCLLNSVNREQNSSG
jgi:hypothetical protein